MSEKQYTVGDCINWENSVVGVVQGEITTVKGNIYRTDKGVWVHESDIIEL